MCVFFRLVDRERNNNEIEKNKKLKFENEIKEEDVGRIFTLLFRKLFLFFI